jgi:hypothetical protein
MVILPPRSEPCRRHAVTQSGLRPAVPGSNMADYRFRVSDAYFVPLRGWMLRLKLLDGTFEPSMLKPGGSLRLVAPDGEERVVSVVGRGATGGIQNKDRIAAYREYDIVIPEEDAVRDGRPVDLGWEARPD